MSDSIQNNNLGERDVIVWIPFTVKLKDLQAAMMPSMAMLPQPIPRPQSPTMTVHPIQEEDQPALLPAHPEQPRMENKQRKWEASEKQMEWIHNIARQLDKTEAEICQVIGVPSLDRLSKAQASSFINDYKEGKLQF